MRVAICFTGHVREYIKYKNILNILTRDRSHEYDIFISTWDIKNTINSHSFERRGYNDFNKINISEIIEIYNPVSYLVEKNNDLIFNKYQKYKGTNNPIAVFSQFYKVNQVSKIMNDYAVSNDYNYDLVIRTRFDVEISNEFNINNYFNEYFNVEEDGCGNKWCSDKFSISTYNNFMIFSNFFNEIENLIISNMTNIPEILLDIYLDRNNIKKLKHSNLIVKFG